MQAASEKGVTVAEVTYCNSNSVAEHNVMMILALARNYIPSHQWVIDKGWNRINREAKKLNRAFTKVGFFSEDRPDGSDIVEVAVVNEYGTEDGRIPERSMIRAWRDQNKRKIDRFIAKLYGHVLIGRLTARGAVKKLGEWAQGEIKQFIIDMESPPNAPATIAKKGSSNPLIDEGILVNSVRHEDHVK